MSMPAAALLTRPFSGLKAEADTAKDKDGDKDKSRKRSKASEDDDNEFGNTIDTPLLSEYMSVQGNSMVVLRGVGLLTGLDGTGGDPSPSAMRTQLQNEMARRGVKNARRILADSNTALVVVTAYLPPMVRKGQRFDVRVALPPNSNAKSLKGGWLLETRLFEEQNISGQTSLKAQEYAVCGGAVLTSLGVREDREKKQAELMSGTIPGGAISKVDRDLSIVLRTEKRSIRNSKRIADAVSARFHRYNSFGQRIVCAEAKTDAQIQLKAHEQYRNNFPRYQSVIRNIAFNETEVARRIRMEQLARNILDPELCQTAALQLEAIGEESIPFLKDALESEHFEVRFQAAQALAYLSDASGVAVLTDAAREQPAFRVYALVALSVIDDADAVVALRELMNAPDMETRYGAFRALKESEPLDPSLHPIEFQNRFTVHVIDSTGAPMVHATRRRSPEVVLFGARQGLILKAVLNAGRNIRVMGESGSSQVDVILYQLNTEPQRARVPNELFAILKACGDFGATYPDIVQLLIEAEQQRNLAGTFGIDRLPQAGRLYVARTDNDSASDDSTSGAESAEADPDDENARRLGSARQIPGLFDELGEDELKELETDEKLESLDFSAVAERDQSRPSTAPGTNPVDPEMSGPTDGDTDSSESSPAGDSTKSAADSTAVQKPETADTMSAETVTDSDADSLPEPEGTEPRKRFHFRWWNRVTQPFGGLEEPEP
jgi:flagellar basal body P-ring protein FlgI